METKNPAPQQPNNSVQPSSSWFSLHHKLIYMLIAAAVIATAVFAYLAISNGKSTNSDQQAVVHQPKPDPTADWKTYTDTKYGFVIKYPSTSTVPKVQQSGPGQFELSINYLNAEGNDPSRLEINTAGDPRWGVTGTGHMDIVPQKTNKFDGNNSIGKVYEGENPIEFTLGNNYVYANCVNYKKDPAVIEFCNQVLSTFKFTDTTSADTSTWKTYSNNSFGYSVQYPSTWVSTVKFNQGSQSQVEINGSEGSITIDENADFGGGPCSSVGKLTQISTGVGSFTGCVTSSGITVTGDSGFLSHNNNKYVLNATWTSASKQQVLQILSTFKFTK